MKILIVSWYFPPTNTIGALRVATFARFLVDRGHEIAVIAGRDRAWPETLPLGFELDRLAYAKSIDINAAPRLVARWLARLRGRQGQEAAAPGTTGGDAGGRAQASLRRRISTFYTMLLNIPDQEIGWYPDLVRQGMRLCRDWRPDIIFGSGPLFTAFLGCRTLSRRLGVPWVGEIRDVWADNPYDEFLPRWRVAIDRWIERCVLDTAAGLVTVTEPAAELYRARYSKPVVTIYNGYDPTDFERPESDEAFAPFENFVIGYAGAIYPGRRDPTPLFQALRMLGDEAAGIRVIFCGTNPAHVVPLARKEGVEQLVEVRPAVPHKESIAFQRKSDVLLLLLWNDPREEGIVPGKVFEYIASLRPILMLGYENGVTAGIIRRQEAGVCLNDPRQIADRLLAWLQDKREHGRVRPLPASARDGLSRTIQYERLQSFLGDVLQAR
jgi:glycosyltransferase involved in cell wall biosynthesis